MVFFQCAINRLMWLVIRVCLVKTTKNSFAHQKNMEKIELRLDYYLISRLEKWLSCIANG